MQHRVHVVLQDVDLVCHVVEFVLARRDFMCIGLPDSPGRRSAGACSWGIALGHPFIMLQLHASRPKKKNGIGSVCVTHHNATNFTKGERDIAP